MNKFIKITCRSLALATFCAIAVGPALGQGTMIIQHSGAADPLTEGFVGHAFGGSPVFNDAGVNAWATPSSTNSSSSYGYFLSSQQQIETTGANWTFTVNVRVATEHASTNPVAFYAGLEVGSEGYLLLFDSTPTGDPDELYLSVNSGPTNIVNLTGAGSTYNNYQLIYNASADMASLWINGVEYTNDISPLQQHNGSQVYWGSEGTSAYELANWNLVSFEITPEPTTICLLLFGSGVLIYVLKRRRFRS
jgi:hypothetical protein